MTSITLMLDHIAEYHIHQMFSNITRVLTTLLTSSASSATVERANYQHVKSVCIRSFSCPYFPTFGLESPYLVRMRENTDQKFFEYGHLPTFRYIKE